MRPADLVMEALATTIPEVRWIKSSPANFVVPMSTAKLVNQSVSSPCVNPGDESVPRYGNRDVPFAFTDGLLAAA